MARLDSGVVTSSTTWELAFACTFYLKPWEGAQMKLSKQVEAVIGKLNVIPDEVLSEEIQDHILEAYGHLEGEHLDLEEAGL
jgi:hypothetical protein